MFVVFQKLIPSPYLRGWITFYPSSMLTHPHPPQRTSSETKRSAKTKKKIKKKDDNILSHGLRLKQDRDSGACVTLKISGFPLGLINIEMILEIPPQMPLEIKAKN